MVSYGAEVFGGVHPRQWSPEMMEDYLSFQAYGILKEEQRKHGDNR